MEIMSNAQVRSYTVFDGQRRIATDKLAAIALVAKRAIEGGAAGPVLIFDNDTGRSLDINTRGTNDEVLTRLGLEAASETVTENPAVIDLSSGTGEPIHAESPDHGQRGRGRPKLGVVAREVTLLPRHWEWLGTQPGGASVALRKLVEEARRRSADKDRIRKAHERAYHFMSAMAGDLPGFEEGIRALFANDRGKFNQLISGWPEDIRDHARHLAFAETSSAPEN